MKARIYILLILLSFALQAAAKKFPLYKINVKFEKPETFFLLTPENVNEVKKNIANNVNVCEASKISFENALSNPNYQVLVKENNYNETVTFVKFPHFEINQSFSLTLKEKFRGQCISIKNASLEYLSDCTGIIPIGNYISFLYKVTTPEISYYSEGFFIEKRNSTILVTINTIDKSDNIQLIRTIESISGEEYDKNIEEFTQLYRKKDFINAFNKLSAAVKLEPANVIAYEKRIAINMAQKKYLEVLNDVDVILNLEKNNVNGYITKGLANYYLRNYEESIDNFDKAQQILLVLTLANIQNEYYCSFAEIYRLKGEAYINLNNPEKALKNLELALELSYDSLNTASVYYNLGIVKSTLLKKSDEAIKNYTQAIKHYPAKSRKEKSEAYYNRGLNKRYLNDLKGAISDYDIAIDLNPEYAKAYNNRGFVYKLLNESTKADSDFTNALKFSKDSSINAMALINILEIALQKSDFERCLKTAENLISISDQNKENLKTAYYFRGISKLALDNMDGCKDLKMYIKMGGSVPQEILKYCN